MNKQSSLNDSYIKSGDSKIFVKESSHIYKNIKNLSYASND
jgi:hypothetical protein